MAEICGAYSPESLPPWLPQLKSTTKEPTTTGEGVSPATTAADNDDVAEGIPSVDVGTVANAVKVGASGADQSQVAVSSGESSVGSGWEASSGKQTPPLKQTPPEPLVKPKKPLPLTTVNKSNDVIQRSCPAKVKLIDKNRKLQIHNPDVNLRICWFPTYTKYTLISQNTSC